MNKQSGFSAFEGLLIVVILGVVGFTGWYVWHSRQNVDRVSMQATTNSQPSTHNKKYTDTAKVYTLSYPSSWKLSYDPTGSSEGGIAVHDWTKESREIKLYLPNGTPKSNSFPRGVVVSVTPADDVTVMDHQEAADRFHTVTKMKINGYDTYLDHVEFVGPGAAEKYTDDYYVLIHNGKAVTLVFREKYYHNNITPPESWDDSKFLPAVKDIVNSIKFQ